VFGVVLKRERVVSVFFEFECVLGGDRHDTGFLRVVGRTESCMWRWERYELRFYLRGCCYLNLRKSLV